MFKKLDKKLKTLILGAIGIVVLLILIALLIYFIANRKVSFDGVETKMITAAEKYYAANSNRLPQIEGNSVEVSLDTLVSEGYMKEVSKYVKDKNVSCTGRVTVTKSKEYLNYSPYLNCGEQYKTAFLYEQLKKDIVTSGDGLYEMSLTSVDDSGNKSLKPFYVYRGDYVNNYISIEDKIWRVVKLDDRNNMMIIYNGTDLESIWDDRFNAEKNSDTGINDYELSRIKKNIEDIYNSETFSANFKSKLINYNACTGKRSSTQAVNDGSIECSKVLKDQYFALLPTYDFMNASLDTTCKTLDDLQCSNYNYLSAYDRTWAFMTGDADTTHKIYKYSNTLAKGSPKNNSRLRLVAYLNKNVSIISGSGTELDPYIVK